jgi:serine/threonine-protein kinase
MKYCTVCNGKYEDSVSFCPRDGEVLEDDPSSLVDQTLDGQYQIEALLGRGGMGAVYRARHILLGDRVAIKVLPPQMRNNAEWLRRFRREGQAARRFRHPNAVTVYDLRTTADGLIYMVMEYVEGHTLDAELKRRGRFTPLEAMAVLEPVMSVLNAAHQMGVVHRDLKPENIMLGKGAQAERPVVKLLDLGIAKMLEVAGSEASGATALTIAGQILGTPYYMSPEQWGEVPRDGRTEIDGRADIYSLGTVFYELVAGRKPFQAQTLQELRRQHVQSSMPPLREVLPEVPEGFSRAIERAMSKDRGDRPATAGELDAELRVALGLPPADISALAFAQTGSSSGPLETEERAQTGPRAAGAESSAGQVSGPKTGDGGEVRQTSSDVSAPTLLTVDQEPWDATSARHGAESAQPASQPPETLTVAAGQDEAQQGQMQRTIATHPSALSQAQQSPSQPIAHASFAGGAAVPTPSLAPDVQGARRSPVPAIAAVALLLLLVVGGLGGWFIYRRMNARAERREARVASNVGTGGEKGDASASGSSATEALRYWLDVAPPGRCKVCENSRLAGDVTLRSGQQFKFHLVAREDGYLYIIGPGEGSVPTTFLTAKPITKYAATNQVKGGVDYTFPSGDANWLEEDKTTGEERYTLIFSRTALDSPAFLGAQAGRALSAAEQAELADFRSKQEANSRAASVNEAGGREPFVSVKMAGQTGDSPVIIDVLIDHQ